MGARAIETAERMKTPILFAGILLICAWLMHSFRSQAGEPPSPGLQYRVEEEITRGDRHHVTVTIQNTGDANGDEVGLGLDRAVETKAPRQLRRRPALWALGQ